MNEIDCSNILNYKKERERMCDLYLKTNCEGCPMDDAYIDCDKITEINQKHINIVQKFSNEHPIITKKEKFIKLMEDNNLKYILCSNKYPMLLCQKIKCNECEIYWNEIVEE